MSPILLDNRDIIKLGVTAATVIVLVFSSGFLFGSHQVNGRNVRAAVSEPLVLPVKKSQLAIDVQQQIPEVVAAGKVIDVDQPESAKAATKKPLLPTKMSKTQVVSSSVKKVSGEVKPSITADDKNQITLNDTANSEPVSISDEVFAKAKYSIQVGMFGRLANAELMAEKLRLQNLQAYVADYINKKNEVRFNVKFGYFPNKKIANAALQEYINIQSGEGYLVNFTADSLTHTEAASSTVALDKTLKSVSDESLKKSKDNDKNTVTITSEILTEALTEAQLQNSEVQLIEEADKQIYN